MRTLDGINWLLWTILTFQCFIICDFPVYYSMDCYLSGLCFVNVGKYVFTRQRVLYFRRNAAQRKKLNFSASNSQNTLIFTWIPSQNHTISKKFLPSWIPKLGSCAKFEFSNLACQVLCQVYQPLELGRYLEFGLFTPPLCTFSRASFLLSESKFWICCTSISRYLGMRGVFGKNPLLLRTFCSHYISGSSSGWRNSVQEFSQRAIFCDFLILPLKLFSDFGNLHWGRTLLLAHHPQSSVRCWTRTRAACFVCDQTQNAGNGVRAKWAAAGYAGWISWGGALWTCSLMMILWWKGWTVDDNMDEFADDGAGCFISSHELEILD